MSIQISRILHAGYLVESLETRILMDPLFETPFSRNCYAFPTVSFDEVFIRNQSFDAVVISHYHDDHCSFASLDWIDRGTPIYMYCLYDEMFDLLRELGFHNLHPLKIDSPVTIGSITFTARRAFDKDVDCLLQLRTQNLNILNVVDSWIDDDTMNLLEKEGPWDVIAWPFQAMREVDVISPLRAMEPVQNVPEEWLEQLERLQPHYVIPSSCQFQMESWSWYNHYFFPISYDAFQKSVEERMAKTKVWRLDPSQGIRLSAQSAEPCAPFPGVKLLEPANSVDYSIDIERSIPSTESVAQHLPAVSEQQALRVSHFLAEELAERWKSIDLDSSDYFKTPKLWHLTVWDHESNPHHIYYRVQEFHCDILSGLSAPAQWRTEVPMSTLYGALENGESLTSLYARINDERLAQAVEMEIQDCDVLLDPLLRCLYAGEFASYQKAQLFKLKQRAVDPNSTLANT